MSTRFQSCDGKAIDPHTGLIDHAAPERRQIIASVPDSAFERVLAQVAFERARADKLEMALREAHLACCQGDRERACNILMGALTP